MIDDGRFVEYRAYFITKLGGNRGQTHAGKCCSFAEETNATRKQKVGDCSSRFATSLWCFGDFDSPSRAEPSYLKV